ncbi:tripartite tricarboxylate transporter substrate-binding protein, partial [Streptomyces scabiei]
APGGPTDVSARLFAPEFSARLGVNVLVENRSGAGGGIGLRYVQSVAPSLVNRTILVGSTSTQTVLPLMDPQQVGFNPVEEMVPIGL